MMSHKGNASQYKLLFHLSDAKTFWKMYSLTEFLRKSYLCCGRYKIIKMSEKKNLPSAEISSIVNKPIPLEFSKVVLKWTLNN